MAATPLGMAISHEAAKAGMRLVLSDINVEELQRCASNLDDLGAEVLAVPVDMSQAEQVQSLATMVIQKYGQIDIIFNNASGFSTESIWESAPKEWQSILNVKLWSVINSLQVFIPIMIPQQSSSHIINIACTHDLQEKPETEESHTTIQAIVSLSKTLRNDLLNQNSHIGVSVLCPKWIKTKHNDDEFGLPIELLPKATKTNENLIIKKSNINSASIDVDNADPTEIAGQLFNAIRQNKFYIFV